MCQPRSPVEILDVATAPVTDRRAEPRLAVVIAHPDDEALALGARLPRQRGSIFLHITDGAPSSGADAYRDARWGASWKAPFHSPESPLLKVIRSMFRISGGVFDWNGSHHRYWIYCNRIRQRPFLPIPTRAATPTTMPAPLP